MRIIIPIYGNHEQQIKLALSRWDDHTLLGATLNLLRSFGMSEIVVTSENDAVLSEADRHHVFTKKILLPPNVTGKETYLPAGTLHSLQCLKEFRQDNTLVLWHSTPWLNKEFLDSFLKLDFGNSVRMYTTLRENRNNPCQFFEGVYLHEAVIFVPASEDTSDGKFLRSQQFPFDWIARHHDRTRTYFERRIENGNLVYHPASATPETWPGEGIWEKLDESHARLIISSDNCYRRCMTNGQLRTAAIGLGGHGPEGFEILKDAETNEMFLAVPQKEQSALEKFSVKIWTLQGNSIQPWLINGLSCNSKNCEKILSLTGSIEKKAIALSDIPVNSSLLIWFVQNLNGNSEINTQLTWIPKRGGWYLNSDSQIALCGTDQVICGRQDFPQIFEPDGQATLFAPGFFPAEEPCLGDPLVRGLNTENLFPRPILHPLDVFRVRYFLSQQTDNELCMSKSMT